MSAVAGVSIANEVLNERDRQDAKWGEQNHPDGTGPEQLILIGTWLNLDNGSVGFGECLEDYGAKEIARAATQATDNAAKHGNVTWADILFEEVTEAFAEDDAAKLRVELIQVAAVAQQWIEAIDRRNA